MSVPRMRALKKDKAQNKIKANSLGQTIKSDL